MCVPEDNITSLLMMIKIESIFCLIKIHLTNNHLAPNFSRECKKMNKAQSLQCLSSAGTATIRPVMRGSHPEPFALEGTFSQTLKHRTFFFLPLDLVLWESFVKVQQPIEPEKLQWAEVHTSHRHPIPHTPRQEDGALNSELWGYTWVGVVCSPEED